MLDLANLLLKTWAWGYIGSISSHFVSWCSLPHTTPHWEKGKQLHSPDDWKSSQGFENEAYLYILFCCAAEEDYLALYSCGEKKQLRLSTNFISSHIDYSQLNYITQYPATAIKSWAK